MLTWVDGHGAVEARLTGAQMLARGYAVMARLREEGLHRGDRVLLVFEFDSSVEFLVGLWGCVLAGCVPVPLYPPNLQQGAMWLLVNVMMMLCVYGCVRAAICVVRVPVSRP